MIPGNEESEPPAPAIRELAALIERIEAGQLSQDQAKAALAELFGRWPGVGRSFAEAMREMARLKGAPSAVVQWESWLNLGSSSEEQST